MSGYLARLKQLENEKNSRHPPDSEPSKPAKASFVGFGGKHPGCDVQKINGRVYLTVEQETAIRAWMAHIEESDEAVIIEWLDNCCSNPETLEYLLERVKELPVLEDDCLNLT